MVVNQVAAVAVAKDEAAYLSEWVHHHIFLGFNPIYVLVNRSTDATEAVLRLISEKYPQVLGINVDWIDFSKAPESLGSPRVQTIAYSYAVKLLMDLKSVSHVLFVDIDEFWFSNKFFVNIVDYLSDFDSFDTMSFYWLGQSAESEPFMQPFENKSFSYNPHFKSILNLRSNNKLDAINIHLPKVLGDNVVNIDANGCSLKWEAWGRNPGFSRRLMNASVLHRMQRSEIEYCANLLGGSTNPSFPIKNNRHGFFARKDGALGFDNEFLKSYHESLDKFNEECCLNQIIEHARALLVKQADELLVLDQEVISGNQKILEKVLKGTRYFDVVLGRL